MPTSTMINPEIKIIEQMDRGLAYAEACFETIRVIHGEVFALSAHVQRLSTALHTLGVPCALGDVHGWFEQAISHAKTQGDDILLRMTVSSGEARWGLLQPEIMQPNVLVQCMSAVQRSPLNLRAVLQSWPLVEKKAKYTADYAQALRAKSLWQGQLLQAEMPLFYTESKYILATLTANILIFRHQQWHTPESLGVLNGIVRSFLCHQHKVVAAACPLLWLEDCEAVLCINSGCFMQVVRQINGRLLDVNHPAILYLKAFLNTQPGVSIGDHA